MVSCVLPMFYRLVVHGASSHVRFVTPKSAKALLDAVKGHNPT